MPLRLVEVILPREKDKAVRKLLEDRKVEGAWHEPLEEKMSLTRILLSAEGTQELLDLLQKHFSKEEGFRILLLPVEATVPQPKPPEEERPRQGAKAFLPDPREEGKSISREELYADITDAARVTRIYLLMVALSTIVATIGLLRDDVAVIIGAMVIAPLLGPNVALSLATNLGDTGLARRALKAGGAGIGLAFALSVGFGALLPVDPATPQLVDRTQIGPGDLGLALASGSAGAIAFTTGVSAALVGVMVAVALLPPLVAVGLLLGSGHPALALGALWLFVANLVCVNLAGVATFIARGIRPRTWWEADRAKKASLRAMALWGSLLAVLAAILALFRSF